MKMRSNYTYKVAYRLIHLFTPAHCQDSFLRPGMSGFFYFLQNKIRNPVNVVIHQNLIFTGVGLHWLLTYLKFFNYYSLIQPKMTITFIIMTKCFIPKFT